MAAAAVLIPIFAEIAAAAAPEVLGLTVAEGLGAGALLGAGGGLLGDVAGGKPISPLDVGLGAAGGAAGGFLGAGGLGELANAVGLGGASTAPIGAPGMAEAAAAQGLETSSPFATAAASPAAAGAGTTAAGAAGGSVGSLPDFPVSSEPGYGVGAPVNTIAPTSGVFSSLKGAYQAAKPAISAAGDVMTIGSLANAILGGSKTPTPGGAYTTPRPSMYAGVQPGVGEGPLGSQYGVNPQTGQTGYYTPPKGTMSSPSGMWS